MKKMIQLGIAIAALFYAAIPSYAVSIGFKQLNPFDTIGDSVNVEVVVSGLVDVSSPPQSIGGFDINVAYDVSVLDFSSYELGPFLGDMDSDEAQNFSDGENQKSKGAINLSELSFLDTKALSLLQSSTFSLATLSFVVRAVQSSTLKLIYPSSLSDQNYISDDKGGNIEFEQITGTVAPAPVPEPATLFLFGAGLAGLAGFDRKKFRKK